MALRSNDQFESSHWLPPNPACSQKNKEVFRIELMDHPRVEPETKEVFQIRLVDHTCVEP